MSVIFDCCIYNIINITQKILHRFVIFKKFRDLIIKSGEVSEFFYPAGIFYETAVENESPAVA